MANENNPTGKSSLGINFLPDFYQTPANKKFLQSTIDQLYQPGTLTKTSGFIGRKNAKAAKGADVYVESANTLRQNYQLEPGLTVKDFLGNTTFFKDYQDYINQLGVFGANTTRHDRLSKQEFYSWDPHIDWDKFVNFQNYYWLPYGPDPINIYGQPINIESTYTVSIESTGNANQYVFTPDGFAPNPILKLYRGQTYTFEISSEGNPFSIKTARSIGITNRYVTSDISEYGIENGVLVFTVPIDAPSILFYQSETDINLGGAIEIHDITDASVLDIEKDLLGKKTYTLSDGTSLSNGMKLKFNGNVTPASYSTGLYYVEGVGVAIKLVAEKLLEIVSPYTTSQNILFDATPFDQFPFDDATGYSTLKDYVVVNRASRDHNPWSRYNRWFHKDVISASATYNGIATSLDQAARANRPIIEFEADLKLYNLGTTAIADTDLIDDFTTDVFSLIEGSRGYNIDGVDLAPGYRVLFTADTDPLVNGKVFEVSFINISGYGQIHLTEVASPELNQNTIILKGTNNQSAMYWYDSSTWVKGQQKTNTNQAPLFDIVDGNGISYSDTSVYDGSTFAGTSLFCYKIASTGSKDTVLGFPLSYQNVSNIGDIVFSFNLASDTFQYKVGTNAVTKKTSAGYLSGKDYAGNMQYLNGWQVSKATAVQAGVRIYKDSNQTNNFSIDIFDDITNLTDLVVKVYVNGVYLQSSNYSIVDTPVYKKVVLTTDIGLTDILTIKAYSSQAINTNGYYEIPLNLQNNPLNDSMLDFTLGEVTDHVESMIENISTFVGVFPGAGNLRDLGNITQYGTKFVQHSGPGSLSQYHITSESHNIIKAIEHSRNDYGSFKRNFIEVAGSLGLNTDTVTHVDLVLQKSNANKPKTAPYYFSDMVPYGASIKTDLSVVDYRVKTYPLTSVFTLDALSNKAVGVYLNGMQLVHGRDYSFSSQEFVVIADSLAIKAGDTITTIEYDNTDGCYIPETPTKLGLWPKFVPQMYLDTTLVTPVTMIQGHDGSQILAYGDYRDDLLLELETRIYNNIKVTYDASIFDINDILPSYVRDQDYTPDEFNQVLAPYFYQWAGLVGVDFSQHISFDRANSFTYNYSSNKSPTQTTIPAYWRGIYRYMLDTDRPNICPWEMLGFSVQPTWWTQVYGPAPYTSDNLVLWTDLANGVVRQPNVPARTIAKYKRPFLLKHIPVDSSGNLVSPQVSGLAQGTITQNIDNNFVFGDVGPVEAAWRRSSYYSFSVLIASMLLTPAKTFGVLLDRSRIVRNNANQLVYKDTNLRIRPADLVVPNIYADSTRAQTAGIVNYVVNLITNIIFSNNLDSYNAYKNDLQNLIPRLSYRLSAFTNQNQFNLLLESKTPLATGNVFIPTESYTVFLNSSSPVTKLTYSGVVLTKLSTGFEIKGYSNSQPYFKYYGHFASGTLVNVGGISESYVDWTANQQYISGQIVKYSSNFYIAKTNVTAGTTFEATNFTKLDSLPIVGGANAYFRTHWDKETVLTAPYGTVFTTIQEVVDFLLGYEQWLIDQGFVFEEFNNNLSVVANWQTSAKEFMFWTTQNWSTGQQYWTDWLPSQPYTYGTIVRYDGAYYSAAFNLPVNPVFDFAQWTLLAGLTNIGGSVISLSPGANGVTFKTDLTVVDDITNIFNSYEFFKVDGSTIKPSELDSYRDGNTVTYSPRTTDGIYGATFYLIQNEHVIIIDNTDIFNDIIYSPTSGYRRDRIKISGYVTNGWYGGLDIPGFIFDSAKVSNWQPYTDYNLGDIVYYQGNYYSANNGIVGSTSFIASYWNKLSKAPSAELLPNWTNSATQFVDFYSLNVDNFNPQHQQFAQHLIGYQSRQYLHNIIQDPVSEFKFYQGMIREKGTQNVLNHLFGVLNADKTESLTFYEEWALRVGRYGASNAVEDFEIILDETLFKNNPQGYALVNRKDSNISSFIIQTTPNDVYVKPLRYESAPFPASTNTNSLLRSAGYVNPDDVKFSLKTIDDIVNQDITQLSEGDYVWCSFEGASWNVYRFTDLLIRASGVTFNNSVLTITTQSIVPLTVGSYVGLSLASVGSAAPDVINGFYQIASVTLNSFTINTTKNIATPFTKTNQLVIFALVSRKITNVDVLDTLPLAHTLTGDLVWTDDDGTGSWAVWKYALVYKQKALTNLNPQSGLANGSSIALNKQGTILAVGNSQGYITVYDKVGSSVSFTQRATLTTPFLAFNDTVNPGRNVKLSQVGTVLSLSSDATWLVVGSPAVGYIATSFKGAYSSTTAYSINSIVSVTTGSSITYWQAVSAVPANNIPAIDSIYWESIPYIPVSQITGSNSTLASQGVISLYKKSSNNDYTFIDSIVSPLPAANEQFGSSVAFGADSMYVGAPGYSNGIGRVYKFKYTTVQYASTVYNPNGSSKNVVAVASTAGIRAGMTINGKGFTSGQIVDALLIKIRLAVNSSGNTVSINNPTLTPNNLSVGMTATGPGILAAASIYSLGVEQVLVNGVYKSYNYVIISSLQDVDASILTSVVFNNDNNLTFSVLVLNFTPSVIGLNTLLLNEIPDSTPSGALTFTETTWAYDFTSNFIGSAANNIGYAISTSNDGNFLAISAIGKAVSVYKSNVLIQTLSAPARLPTQNPITSWGQSVSISDDGTYLAIADPNAPLGSLYEGLVNVYQYADTGYTYLSTLTNHNPQQNGQFGSSISFMNDYKSLVVYSKNGDTSTVRNFDNGTTTFDKRSTTFTETEAHAGRVDVYDIYNNIWVFSESLPTNNLPTDLYGVGIAVGSNNVVVSAPGALDGSLLSGQVYSYNKQPNKYAWSIFRSQNISADVSKVKKAFIYDKKLETLTTYLDVIDPLQGKIAGPAEEELEYKTYYDPATYSYSTTTDATKDTISYWDSPQVGKLWWDLRTAKFRENRFDDFNYRNNTWNTLATGASVDVYEWVESKLKPSAWDAIADSPSGLTKGISGTSLYGDTAYSMLEKYDTTSKVFNNLYYFWVKNKKTIPNVQGRYMAANDVAKLIASPREQGYTCLAITGVDSFSLINAASYLKSLDRVLAIEYWTVEKTDQSIHSQWSLISNDTIVDLPPAIEEKWIDSLCGVDAGGRAVPDPLLPAKLRYGIENRPRQGMFINRIEALKEFIERVNRVLLVQQIVESRNISDLELKDPTPTTLSGLYDRTYDTYLDFTTNQGAVSFTLPVLIPVIVNGRIQSVTISNAGKGYIVAPTITVVGSGENAVVTCKINTAGQVTSVEVKNAGYGYTSTTQLVVRDFSVLVKSDSTTGNLWSIYGFNSVDKVWSKTLTQSYDVTDYWSKVDWYQTGFSQYSAADYAVATIADISSITVSVGQLVKVLTANNGGWLLLEKYADGSLIDYTQSYRTVGIQDGTIQFSTKLYKLQNTNVGYDSNIFDASDFDVQAVAELRIILNTIKNHILIGDLKQEYLNLFLATVHYVHTEQLYVDWIFKTSFVRATHSVGQLDQPVNYPVDNLVNFEDYVAEVKPYRTKVRQYISQYSNSLLPDLSLSAVTDFDLQASPDKNLTVYPWKFWNDNHGYKVLEIKVPNGGSGYVIPPQVVIDAPTGPNPQQASAVAFIKNGKVTSISVLVNGSGYIVTPNIILNGGLNIGGTPGTAVAILGDGVVRSTKTELRFDRIDQNYYITDLSAQDTFTGTASLVQFVLTWAPDIKIGKTTVLIDGVPVLRELYTLEITTNKTLGYTCYAGKITFKTAPSKGSTVVVNYYKDISILNAADRIQYGYNPTVGQLGKDLTQLMTGIDYGGVTVSGLSFDVGNGWGVNGYWTDKWDSRDPTFNDYIVQVTANTTVFTLPYIPPTGTQINVYWKKLANIIYTSDGTTVKYLVDNSITDQQVSIITTANTVARTANYVSAGSGGFTVKVSSTTGLLAGMYISGLGFLSRQYIIRVVDSTTLTVSGIPDSTSLQRAYVANGSVGTTIVVNTTRKLVVGMLVSGVGITQGQRIASILDSTRLVLTAIPDGTPVDAELITFSSIPTDGSTLTFSNIAGTSTLNLNSVAGIKVGSVVTNSLISASSMIIGTKYTIQSIGTTDFTLVGAVSNLLGLSFTATGVGTGTGTVSTSSVFAYNTIVTSVNTTYNTVTLSNIVFANVPAGTRLTFTQALTELVDVSYYSGYIMLQTAYTSGTTIQISGFWPSVRLDALDFDGSSSASNANAIIPTPIAGSSIYSPTVIEGGANGATSIIVTVVDDGGTATDSSRIILDGNQIDTNIINVIELPPTFVVNSGDEFILRQSTSDGSIAPADNDYDTLISGGDLAYATATGILADDIVIDGDGLITPTSSPAPEEVVPGQVVDTVAIKVFDQAASGSANIKVMSYTGDGVNRIFAIGQTPNSQRAVIVRNGSAILTYNTDYQIDYRHGNIIFIKKTDPVTQVVTDKTPSIGQNIIISSIGFNGSNVLDIDYFVGDGVTKEFVTSAKFNNSVTTLIYVDGVASNALTFQTDTTYSQSNLIGLRFTDSPPAGALINYIIVSGNQQTFAVTTTETVDTTKLVLAQDGSASYKLTYPIGNSLPNEGNMIVRVGSSILQGPNNSYFTIGKNKLTYTVDPTKAVPNSVPAANVLVYANGYKLTPGTDYTVDATGISVKITRSVYSTYTGQQLTISLTNSQTYSYDSASSTITFATTPVTTPVEVIASYVHDILDIQRTTVSYSSSYALTAGTSLFYTYTNILGGYITLDRSVLDPNYVWVIKNSNLLIPGIDYKLNDDLQSIQIQKPLATTDAITVITFPSMPLPQQKLSYMQFKDMLNRVTYVRLNANKVTSLAEDLYWNDLTITVDDASNFDVPNPAGNKPGVIEIRGERIEYFSKSGNVLGQLRRGTLGTGITNINPKGEVVQFIGASEVVPYKDTITNTTLISTGSATLPLAFTPTSADAIEVFVGGWNIQIWEANMPYAMGDIVQVGSYTYNCSVDHTSSADFATDSANWEFFIANTRLRKNTYNVFNINNAPYSPAGDVNFPADFSVTGTTAAITFATAPAFGTQINVVQRTGIDWDGKQTSSLILDTGAVASFVKAVPGVWYTGYKQISNITNPTFDTSNATVDAGNITFDQGN